MMSSSEVEFLAEKEIVQFEPNFTYSRIYLIERDIGPFEAGFPTPVPLWLAVNLKQRRRGRIIAPEWMDVEELQQKKQEEMDSKLFAEMPCKHYMEVAQILLKCAAEDIPRADEVRMLIKDIWDLRIAKLRSSIDSFVKSDGSHAMINHLTLLEINTVRPVLITAMDQIYHLRHSLSGPADTANSQDDW